MVEWADETNLETKLKGIRAKAHEIIKQHLPILIFASVSTYVLNWVFLKYGEPRLMISCTILIAILLFRRGR